MNLGGSIAGVQGRLPLQLGAVIEVSESVSHLVDLIVLATQVLVEVDDGSEVGGG